MATTGVPCSSGRAEPSLRARGLTIDLLADLVTARLATASIEQTDGEAKVVRVRITKEGRRVLRMGQLAGP